MYLLSNENKGTRYDDLVPTDSAAPLNPQVGLHDIITWGMIITTTHMKFRLLTKKKSG